jgi:hypothetical protein
MKPTFFATPLAFRTWLNRATASSTNKFGLRSAVHALKTLFTIG